MSRRTRPHAHANEKAKRHACVCVMSIPTISLRALRRRAHGTCRAGLCKSHPWALRRGQAAGRPSPATKRSPSKTGAGGCWATPKTPQRCALRCDPTFVARPSLIETCACAGSAGAACSSISSGSFAAKEIEQAQRAARQHRARAALQTPTLAAGDGRAARGVAAV